MSRNNHIERKVVVAMSGGVDSSVAALLAKRAGYDPIGVSMQVWDYRKNGGCSSRATCCAPDDFTDARKVAAHLAIPYYVFDFENTFQREVIDKFVSSYSRGITPNPCVDCNSKVKFKELRQRCLSLGCGSVVTGHYARIETVDGEQKLLRALDRAKDQSYFLYNLRRSELHVTLFPLGRLSKAEVRQVAREAGLVTSDKPESQDICFVSGSLQKFLVQIGVERKVGQVIMSDGAVVGEHEGVHNFTVGQRRGLNISGTQLPLYVAEIDSQNNRVIVAERAQLEREEFYVNELSWLDRTVEELFAHGPADCRSTTKCTVQVRSRHSGVVAEISVYSRNIAKVRFLGDCPVVSPGQAAVFYDSGNEIVLGGGRIMAGIGNTH